MSRSTALALVLSAAAAAAAWLTGPPSFDAIDGAEFTVASSGLSICHPPSYPLFLMLLRVMPGFTYASCRLFCSLTAGSAAWLAFSILRAEGSGLRTALMGSVLLICTAPVFAQLNSVEVHGLAMTLVLAAILCRNGRANAYTFSLAVFGGHPLSILLSPLAGPLRWGRRAFLAAVPAALLLFVPLRAGAPLISHYTHPAGAMHLLSYMGLYSDRLETPSPGRLALALGSLGILGGGLLAALAVAGRPRRTEIIALALAMLALASYRIPDPEGLVWIAVIPAWLAAARGLERILKHVRFANLPVVAAILTLAVTGVSSASRASDDIARILAGDMLRGAPPEAVYCVIGHDAFYLAYLISIDDRRPDIIPVDLYGNYFDVRLRPPLPLSVGERPVIATRAWDDARFRLVGLTFTACPSVPDWDGMGIFRYSGRSPDAFARDLVAEAWMRRALQSGQPERDEFGRNAMRWASTATAATRMREALGQE